ncbi:undecaprenyl-diphosphate phosphatase [Fuchsiella alkaliacetigena]|uniref:undecaprenyl-diphosphate phosphatase n=1 Tax=Fuchsiella alkaliacetigena TaxID=957042 RepID=UPI00200A2013|nr:undecaprenyl-diphosphate phosphatase [Fuchsiella alkaliacetigena]MCK8823815.1 undecaprenyl-diphosphate phosphatase [Fuchsiella alkaliacetigena]
MNLIEVIALGIVQGVVDPLPISSSGHLVFVQEFLGIHERLTLSIFLHFGNLLAIVAVFWRDIVEIFKFDKDSNYPRFSKYIIIGIIPVGVTGVLFKSFFEGVFRQTIVFGFMLLITGVLLWLSDKVIKKGKTMGEMNIKDALVVGLAQVTALFPGLSRSGVTITTGLFKGLDRELAVRYSFLMSIPIVLGATLLESIELIRYGTGDVTLLQILVGTLSALISGYIAIKLLMKVVENKKMSFFAYYCWILGLLVILLV